MPKPKSKPKSKLRVFLSVLILVSLGAASGCQLVPLEEPSPLLVRNQHPAQLTVLHPGARGTTPAQAGAGEAALLVDVTNLWLLSDSGPDRITLDGDLVRAALRMRVGLGAGLDVQVELPVIHAGPGALDPFVEGWHQFFGSPDNDRSDNPRKDYRVDARVNRGGNLVSAYELERNGVRLGDVPVLLTWFPWSNLAGGFSLGVRGGVELPTGDEEDGTGNGGVDASVGAVAGWNGHGISVFAWGDHTWVHQADRARDADLDYPDVISAGVGTEVGVHPRVALLSQIQWEQSVLRELDQSNAERDQVILWLGARARLAERLSLDLAVGEDLVRKISPDVQFHAGLRFTW